MSETDRLAAWCDYDTFHNLLELRDGPFGSYGTTQYFNRDGKSWVRMAGALTGHLIDIEIKPDGYMGEIRYADAIDTRDTLSSPTASDS
jgi:hypothetical protein